MSDSLGTLNPVGPVQNLSWVHKALIWPRKLGFVSVLEFRSPLQCGTLLIAAGSTVLMTHCAPYTLRALCRPDPGPAQVLFGLENRVPVDILGSVAHYRADPCLSQQVPQSECPIGFPGLCGPFLEPILGPHSPDLAQKTRSMSISGVPCLPTVQNPAYCSRFRTMNVPLGFLNPEGPVRT